MNINIILDKRRSLKNNSFPVKIRLYYKGKTDYIPTVFCANESEFDELSGLFTITDKKTRAEKMSFNADLLNIVDELTELYDTLKKKSESSISVTRLKDKYLKGGYNEDITLNGCFKQFIETKTGRTAEIYATTLNKIEKYFGGSIYFDDVNYGWLESFEAKMIKEPITNKKGVILRTGLETNARSIHFRNIRAVFNYAIDNEYISQNTYPFRRFKIKKEETIKRAIKIDVLRNIFKFRGSEQQNWSIDVAQIIFFLIGINTKDLFNLGELSDDSTIYKRAKTNRMYNIWIEPELRVLLDKYKGNEGLIFKEQFKLYQSFSKKINEYLEKVCTDLNVPKITTYSLRHSWATIAGYLDIPDKTIKMALGHGKRTTTDIYIDFDMTKVQAANRKVMDYVLEKGVYTTK